MFTEDAYSQFIFFCKSLYHKNGKIRVQLPFLIQETLLPTISEKKSTSLFLPFLTWSVCARKNGIFTKIVLQSYQKRFACNLSIFDVNHSALCDLLTWYHRSTLVWRHLEVVVEYERGLRKKETLDFLFFVSNSFFFLWWYRSALSIRLSKKLCKKVIQTIKVVVCIWNR